MAVTARASAGESGGREPRLVGQAADDVVEPDARQQRDPVPLALAVVRDRVAALGERGGERVGEGLVGELGLLQADDVRGALVEPGQQPGQPGQDGVHVPRRHAHPGDATPPVVSRDGAAAEALRT